MKKWPILLGLVIFATETFAEMRVDMPASVKQGSYFRVDIEDSEGVVDRFSLTFWGRTFQDYGGFPLSSKKYAVLVPVAVDEMPGSAVVKIFGAFGVWEGDIEIQKVDFPESKKIFHVAKPIPVVWARFQKERAFLDDIYAQVTPKKYFSENLQFANPLEKMEIVPNSDFGQIRKKVLVNPKTRRIENRWKDYHKGVDLRASTGVPIFAAEGGKIVAARNLLGSGNTVIIDHGYWLLSLYFHLSKIYLKEGKEAKRGQKIGLAGMSGNAEGSHLHFEVRLYKVPINPLKFFGLGGAK